MTFEEEFPLLQQYASEWLVECAPNEVHEALLKSDVQKYCLDKQRVKEAIEKLCAPDKTAFDDCACEEYLKKELGL